MVSRSQQFEEIILVCPSASLVRQLGDWARNDEHYALCLYPGSTTDGFLKAVASGNRTIIDATETADDAMDALTIALQTEHRPMVYVETGDLAQKMAPRGAAVLQGPLNAGQWTRVIEGDEAR
ncbi:MAG: hypothetical protein ABFD92_13185 [Planctomycetaceae bacterium]|nr:hypothetical protein [Planctomycetaceae bacterium]